MIRNPNRHWQTKRIPGQAVDSIGVRRVGTAGLVNVYDFQKLPAQTQGELGPLPATPPTPGTQTSDVLPLTIGMEFSYGVFPDQLTTDQIDSMPCTIGFDFQYSASVALPDPYGQEETLALVQTFSFTYA